MSNRQDYINRYSGAAMEQMKRYGIPASVILAQGIIESANGQSELSRLGNNHFGIKATRQWLDAGGSYRVYTDDRPNEKFCTYPSVADSYEHHSRFLKENSRYEALFRLSPDDYRGWADGLQAAHYASSPTYAETLRAVIEANGLDGYDRQVMEEMQGREFGVATNPLQPGEKNRPGSRDEVAPHYSFPLDSREFLLVTSPFGMRKDPMDQSKQQMHKGIDLRADHARVLATEDDGRVVAVCNDAGAAGGRSVTVEYDRGNGSRVQVLYSHLDSIAVKVGDCVSAGQELGISGNTGARTTGPHLHFGISQISADGQKRDIDPVSYLADIAVKGGISQQVLHNGGNVLDKYMCREERPVSQAHDHGADNPMDPSDWMRKLLSSEDAGAALGGDPLLDMIVSVFSTLMALALQIDSRGQEDKMQAVTDAALSRRMDLSGLVPGAGECVLSWSGEGSAQLSMTVGDRKVTHALTEGELRRLSSILDDPDRTDADKRQRIAAMTSQIIIRDRVADNYEQQVGQLQGQGLQR